MRYDAGLVCLLKTRYLISAVVALGRLKRIREFAGVFLEPLGC